MEIRLSEKEITLGVVAFLNSRGMNVDPETANIEFSVSRKPAGITAVLHEGPIPVAEPEPETPVKQEAKLVGQAETDGARVSGEVAEKPAEPAPEPEAVEPLVAEPATEAPAEQTTSLFQ